MRYLIKRLVARMGYKITRVKNANPNEVRDALGHYAKQNIADWYSNPNNYRKYVNPERVQFYRRIVQHSMSMGIEYNSKSIIDVGCSFGELLRLISEENPEGGTYYGTEYVEAAVDAARSIFPEGNYRVYDLYTEPSGKYDIVYCTEVLEHLLKPEIAIRHLCQMMSPDGVLYIAVPNGRSDTLWCHVNFWSVESWNHFISHSCKGYHVRTGYVDENETTLYACVKSA
jgi:2-polyprenyl-3-methyl-5-hydroxy-6-metoxy-1,4-benzoquinol methylase